MHYLLFMNEYKCIDKLWKYFSWIFFRQVSSGLDLHKVPQISESIKWQYNCHILILVYNHVFKLANSWNPHKLVHYLNFLFNIFKQIFFFNFFKTHIFQAKQLASLFILAETSNTNHSRTKYFSNRVYAVSQWISIILNKTKFISISINKIIII